MLPVTAQAIIAAEKLKVTYFKLLDFLGGSEGKLVSSSPDIRNYNHAVFYSKASNLSVFIIFFSQQKATRQMFLLTKAWCPGTAGSSSQHIHISHLQQKSLLWTHTSHCMGNESKQRTNFRSWRKIPFPSVQSRNHSNVMDSYAPDSEINSRLMLRDACGMRESPVQVPHPNQEH